MGLEPLRERIALAVREEGDGLAAFQVNEDGAIGLAFAQGEIVDPQHARVSGRPAAAGGAAGAGACCG